MIARDAGGNERHALFSVDATGASELALSDDPDAIHNPGAFSPDGRLVAFTHTGRNGVDFDVAVVAVCGGGRRELAQPGGWSHVADWSEQGILVQRANTPFDHDLFLVDPESGDLTPLTPHDGEVAFDSPRLLAGRLGAVRLRRRERVRPSRRWCARAPPRAADSGRRRRRDRRAGRGAGAARVGDQPRRRERGVARRQAPRRPAGRRRLGARVRARRLADRHVRPAGRLDGRLDGRAGGAPAHALGRRRPRPLGVRAPGARGGRELRRPPHPVPALRRGGRPCAVLGARRAGVAVPAADGPRDPVPLRAGHHRGGAQRARLDRLRAHLPPPRRRASGVSTRSPTWLRWPERWARRRARPWA